MSTLREKVVIYVPNTLIGGSTMTEIAPGPIGEPYITWIVQQYPHDWPRLLDLHDTDHRRPA